jgi:hypothetical protein
MPFVLVLPHPNGKVYNAFGTAGWPKERILIRHKQPSLKPDRGSLFALRSPESEISRSIDVTKVQKNKQILGINFSISEQS